MYKDHGNKLNSSISLINATYEGNLEVVQLLISQGANIESQTKEGATPLYIASEQGYKNIVKYLISHGANKSNYLSYIIKTTC